MRADVSGPPAPLRRLATSVCLLALLGISCSSITGPTVAVPQGRAFIAMVPDSLDDVGLDPSVTVSSEGVPYVSYFGVPAVIGPDEIPITRPVGSPYLTTEEGDDAAAVLLASMTPDSQVWNRGAVAQPRETPGGVTVPFGPASLPSLKSLTPSNAEGTDVAVSGSDIHVVWTGDTGVWYGLGPDFELQAVEATAGAGAPSVVLDEGGSPVVAYAVAGVRPEVRVAERSGERWTTSVAATLARCGSGCPPAVQLTVLNGEPFLVVVDPDSRDLIAATRNGSAWSSEVVAAGVEGGASVAATGDTVAIAYYTSDGIAVARGRPGRWFTDDVGQLASPTPTPSPSPSSGSSAKAEPEKPIETRPTTGVAVDQEGTVWVAWEDGAGVHLASREKEGSFEEAELSQTEGGVTPSLGVAEDGSALYMAWFDPVARDLRVGVSADLGKDLLFAAPSPTPPPTAVGGGEECGKDTAVVLDIVAQNTAFDPTCLVAPADEPFTINFDNQDSILHNIAVLTDQDGDEIAATEPQVGPVKEPLDVEALDAGSYFFVCQVHPDVMRGSLAVVAAGGGGKGGGGTGGGGTGGGGGGGG